MKEAQTLHHVCQGGLSLTAVILQISNCRLWWNVVRRGFSGFAQASGTQFVRNRTFQSFPQKSRALYWNQMCCVHSESEVTFWNTVLFIAPAYIHVVGLWLMVAALAQWLVRQENILTVAKWEQTDELIIWGVKGVAVHILLNTWINPLSLKLHLILHIVSKTADVYMQRTYRSLDVISE